MYFRNTVFCLSNLTQEQILGNLEEWLNNTLLRSSLSNVTYPVPNSTLLHYYYFLQTTRMFMKISTKKKVLLKYPQPAIFIGSIFWYIFHR